MKRILFLLLTAFLFAKVYGNDIPKIDEELIKEMQNNKNSELIKINIIMKSQYDVTVLQQKSSIYKNKSERRDFVVSELKKFAKDEQFEVIDVLNYFAESYLVTDISCKWIYNGINCYASKSVIEELASRDDILIIGYDRIINMLPDNETPKEAEAGAKEITYNVLKVRANQVWDELGYKGQGVLVAVIDTGINYNHNDLKTHMWESDGFPNHGWNFASNNNNPMDDNGHGTHCAGTVAGDGSSGSQTGMAPEAHIMAVKVLNYSGNGTITQICDGVGFAVEHHADILSMSLGVSGGGSVSQRIQFRNTMVNALEAGIVGATGAGNEGQYIGNLNNIRVPGNCPPPWLHPDQTNTGGLTCIVCVGATDANDNIANFSSIGPVTWQHVPGYNDYPYLPGIGLIRPDVCAPGVNIKSLNYSNNYGYTNMDGTSMATPCVAGVMALMMSKNIDLTPAEIDEILETTAVHLSASKSNTYGSGRIDAYVAVNAVTTNPIYIYSVSVNDILGNNNGKINPGENIKLNVGLTNKGDETANSVSATLYSNNQYVTITNSEALFGDILAQDTKHLDDAFSFYLSSMAQGNSIISFTLEIKYGNGEVCNRHFNVAIYDYILSVVGQISVDDANSNNNGILEPGETADLIISLLNFGNEQIEGLTGVLTTTSNDITINNSTFSYGNFTPSEQKSGIFGVTLSTSATPGNINIPLILEATDANNRVYIFNFNYSDRCNVVFNLTDTWGDGWSGAALIVSFDDGTPTQNLTFANGYSASFTIAINSGVTVNLSWQSGLCDNECSYEILYENGTAIYSGIAHSGSGVFFSWLNACQGSLEPCEPVRNLNLTVNGNVASITWSVPVSGSPVEYEVYHNGVLLGSTNSTMFSASMLPGINDFCVAAVYEGCSSSKVCKTYNQICAYEPVYNLTGSTQGLSINLEWDVPAQYPEYYNIYVDDVFLSSSLEPQYHNSQAVSGTGNYNFSVEAVYSNQCHSDRIDVTLLVIPAPYNLKLEVVSDKSIKLEWEYNTTVSYYQVFRDNINIANANEMSFVDDNLQPNTKYCYSVIAVLKDEYYDATSDLSDSQCETTFTGIYDYKKDITIYPNPSKSTVFVEADNIFEISILNAEGRILKKYSFNNINKASIDCSTYSNGAYLLEIKFDNNKTGYKKFVIEK